MPCRTSGIKSNSNTCVMRRPLAQAPSRENSQVANAGYRMWFALVPPRARITIVAFATTGDNNRPQNLAREYRSVGTSSPRTSLPVRSRFAPLPSQTDDSTEAP